MHVYSAGMRNLTQPTYMPFPCLRSGSQIPGGRPQTALARGTSLRSGCRGNSLHPTMQGYERCRQSGRGAPALSAHEPQVVRPHPQRRQHDRQAHRRGPQVQSREIHLRGTHDCYPILGWEAALASNAAREHGPHSNYNPRVAISRSRMAEAALHHGQYSRVLSGFYSLL